MSESPIRICDLEDCDNFIPSDSSPKRKYCCDGHGSLARLRKHRSSKVNEVPYIVVANVCPIDGRIFPTEMYSRGRPKKYDCKSCSEIARQLRLMSRV